MLFAEHLLTLTWDELKDTAKEEIQSGLGNKGPWMHDIPHRHFACHRCGWNGPELQVFTHRQCPIPPPITLEPEVVAERLLRKLEQETGPNFLTAIAETIAEVSEAENDSEAFAYWILATPLQQIVVCLRALDLIGERT